MTTRFDDPRQLTAGGHAFDAITLRCGKCNMPRREWDESRGIAKCQGETVGFGPTTRSTEESRGSTQAPLSEPPSVSDIPGLRRLSCSLSTVLFSTLGERSPLPSCLFQHALALGIVGLCCQFGTFRCFSAVFFS